MLDEEAIKETSCDKRGKLGDGLYLEGLEEGFGQAKAMQISSEPNGHVV